MSMYAGSIEHLEAALAEMGRGMTYPPTPNFAPAVLAGVESARAQRSRRFPALRLVTPQLAIIIALTLLLLACAAVAAYFRLYPIPKGFDVSVNYGHTGADVFVVTADDMDRLVSSPSNDALATWSPDCSRIAFNSNRTTPSGDRFASGNQDIWVMDADGTDPVKLTDRAGGARWSPDGTRIAFRRPEFGEERVPPHGQRPLKSTDIFVINADGTGETRLTDGRGVRELTAWSPDGKRMLLNFAQPDLSWFDSVTWGVDEETLEIYVMNSDGTDMKNLSNRPGKDNNAS